MKKKAFTLVEIMAVVALIAVLFIIFIPRIGFATNRAKLAGVQTDFNRYREAMQTTAMENGGFGGSEIAAREALGANLNEELRFGADNKSTAKDPWGNQYRMRYDRTVERHGGKETVFIASLGKDSKNPEEMLAISGVYRGGQLTQEAEGPGIGETAVSIPKPYNPNNTANALKAGCILTENHGDYGIVDIPALYDGTDYFNTNQHSTDPTSKVTFEFAVSGATAGSYVLLTDKEVSITELTNYDYTSATPAVNTKGSKFRLNLLPGAGEALKKIFNNDGTTGALDHQLFVRSKDAAGFISEYAQVSVPVVYRLSGYVQGFAPNHETVMTLYPLKPETGAPVADYDRNPANYDLTAPIVSMFIDPMEDPGHNLWRQSFDVMSSSLLGKSPAKTTYMLTAERGGNLTYTRVALVLDTTDAAHYNATTKTFRLLETILLKAGDINGDGMVKAQDEFILTSYLQNPGYYTTQKAPGADPATDEGWKRSIYNPNTEAYRCDLNGNGQVDWGDHYDLYMNQNVTTEDYNWKINLAGDMVLPYGLDIYVAPNS